MQSWEVFLLFEDKQYIHEKDFDVLVDYIFGMINSDYSPNRGYFYRIYNYHSKPCIVKNWRKKTVCHLSRNLEK